MAKKVTTKANEAVETVTNSKAVKAGKKTQSDKALATKKVEAKSNKAKQAKSSNEKAPKNDKAKSSSDKSKKGKTVKVKSNEATSLNVDFLNYSYRTSSAIVRISESGEFSLTNKGQAKYCSEFVTFLSAYKKHSVLQDLIAGAYAYMYEHPLFWQLNQIFESEKITAKSALNVAKTAKSLSELVNAIAKKAKHEAVVSEVKMGTQTLYYLGNSEPIVKEIDDKCMKIWAFCGYDKSEPAQNELIDFINTYLRDKFGRKYHEHLYTCVQKLAEQNLERKAMNKAISNVHKSLCDGATGEQVAQNLTKLIK